MNVIERKYYTCEKCGRTSQNEEKIKECEASHLTIKEAENIKLDPDVYSRCVATAKGYYRMLQRQKEIEEEIIHETHAPDGQPRGSGVGDPTGRKVEKILQRQRENDRKIKAVEQAWVSFEDERTRLYIKKNFFEGLLMREICIMMPGGTPMAEITMKRYRKKFLIRLAENLFEI